MDKQTFKKILMIVAFGVILYVGLQDYKTVMNAIGILIAIISPFILGAAIAFMLNVPMRAIEKSLFKKVKNKYLLKLKRLISLILTILIVIGIIWIVMFLIVPEISRTAKTIADSIPEFARRTQDLVENLMTEYPEVFLWLDDITIDWKDALENMALFLKNSSFLSSTIGIASTIIGAFVRFFVGSIFALYILLQKEKLSSQIKKIMYAFLPEKIVDRMISILRLSDRTFSNFLSGQCLEAVILGTMFFISMTFLGFPYAMLVGVLISITALIPIFGAFIGCGIGAFLILVVDPIKALWFIILFLVLQQIEGNLIYPQVVGNSIGLPSIWVLVAVTLGASTMGVLGMLLFIPLSSVIYALLREAVYDRLKDKEISANKLD